MHVDTCTNCEFVTSGHYVGLLLYVNTVLVTRLFTPPFDDIANVENNFFHTIRIDA
jgi:hypothetical protein